MLLNQAKDYGLFVHSLMRGMREWNKTLPFAG
jgi:hypothetical protein